MNTTIFTYWEGPTSPLIDICLESIERWNPGQVKVLGPSDIPPDLLQETEGISLAFRSDMVRLWALLDQGGVWVDADSLATRPLSLLPLVPDLDLFGVHNKNQKTGWGATGITATPLGGRQGSPVLQEMYTHALDDVRKMKSGKKVSYGMTSVGVASWAYKRHQEKPSVRRFEHWKWNPIPWYKARDLYFPKAVPYSHEMGGSWKPLAELYHLTNPITHHYRDAPRTQLETGTSFLAFLVQKALSLRPAIFGRTSEIIRRLPLGALRGTEVGVYKGMNARHLLQQRPDLDLLLVDPWGATTEDSYKRSGDYQASYPKDRWEKIYTKVVPHHLIPYWGRYTLDRRLSAPAAEDVPVWSMDFVFIDADHSYEGVRQDLISWWPKVKPGGFICGHDYGTPKEGKRYGVSQAVNEWASFLGANVETGKDWFWCIRKDVNAT